MDDHPIIRLGLRTILERESSVSVVADLDNGREALAIARKGEVDVMLVDIHMHGN